MSVAAVALSAGAKTPRLPKSQSGPQPAVPAVSTRAPPVVSARALILALTKGGTRKGVMMMKEVPADATVEASEERCQAVRGACVDGSDRFYGIVRTLGWSDGPCLGWSDGPCVINR